MNEVQCFNFGDQPVRVMELDGQPWFVAADVCRVLDIANSRDAVAEFDDDEKGVATADTLGGKQKVLTVSESGLYTLIFKSRKPNAKAFRKWVTSEVLPAIRQQGRYEAAEAMRLSERGRLADLREVLLGTAKDVRAKAVTPGQAQAIAITAQRYLESLKLEGEALGYENVLGLREEKAALGLLPEQKAGAQLLQGMSQRALRGAPEDEPSLSVATAGGEAAVDEGASGPGAAAREAVRGPADLRGGAGARGAGGTGAADLGSGE